jgi:SepF-like predicted cell division protein (DUF552 family)
MTDAERLATLEDALEAIYLRSFVLLEVNFLHAYDRDSLLGVIEELRDRAWVALGPPQPVD